MTKDQRMGINFPVAGPFKFSVANIADSQDGTAVVYDTQGNTPANMPLAGRVVAICARLNAAISAGTITVKVTIDGTEDTTNTCVISGTEQYEVTADFIDGLTEFDAEAVLGCVYDTDANVEANTVDLVVDVYVAFDDPDSM